MASNEQPPAANSGGELSPEEIRRYGRHMVLPEVGREGQERLKRARVLLVGVGGLGSPAGLYLAAAGVGTLGLVDFDRVEVTNLQRQILYGAADVGRPKLEAAAERLSEINPHLTVESHPVRLTSANALEVIPRYDLVIDGSDNFPTRYLVNDACVLAGKPNVYGSIFRFEGQVSVFWGERGPCYRCLFAEPPPPGAVPSCAEGGVLGVLPGIIGSLQANEAIKLLLGVGEPMVGRLLLFDALKLDFRELALRKDPACPVCGESPTVTELIDYEAFCGQDAAPRPASDPPPAGAGGEARAAPGADAMPVPMETTPTEVEQRRQAGAAPLLIDVRTPQEWNICRLEGATWIPLQELPSRYSELDGDGEVVVYCHSGVRSLQAAAFLRQRGFEGAQSLAGGIDRWSREVDPSIPRY